MKEGMNVNKPQTLCWRCRKACGQCSWSDHWMHEPVQGWDAERNDIRANGGALTESYVVYRCPEFQPDGPRWSR